MPQREYGDEDADVYEKASRTRRAEVDRMLDTVVATFTTKQQLVFRLAIREGVVGAALATQLKVKPEEASRRTYEIITMAYPGVWRARLGEGRSPVLS